ncbi:hypothetical protein CVU82_03155 [Candidatus Falkowbacteria bacterium HGW-Falkowbacteria-1]|uniref:Phosphoesterase n=1 Tax=Candidatus Falkowbacteria bacterium HGW-Falkowbacteria-1 TaxID=2013768 RepID=A0A2N2EA21_9BACT|nr:MAG: hypothetical protein CVU82_03155 [Candidatus Falkowbacteria bacterium HGW-Falkowbacteria-1]
MRLAIISDIHDNLANVGLFLKIIENDNIEKIICCGDVCNSETLEYLSKNFIKEIILIRGNMEIYKEDETANYKNINYLGRYGNINLDNIEIGICHEPLFMNNLLQENKKLNFIFYGHTHKPWISMRENATLINPGTLSGVFQKASFAIFDTKTKDIKLKILQ